MITMNGTSLRAPLRNFLLAIWILLLLCIATAFAQERTPAEKAIGEKSQKRLIGVWESPDTTKGGLGAIYEFREDGGLMAGMGALVNSTYDPQDPNLQQFMMQPDDKSPDNDDRPQKIMDGPAGSPSYVGVLEIPPLYGRIRLSAAHGRRAHHAQGAISDAVGSVRSRRKETTDHPTRKSPRRCGIQSHR